MARPPIYIRGIATFYPTERLSGGSSRRPIKRRNADFSIELKKIKWPIKQKFE